MTLNLNIGADDYTDRVKKSLNDFRRKAEVRGFRKGMVPMGLIQKMYGRTALLEEVNKLISEGIEKHLNDNNIKIIGEPIPNEEHTKEIDWEHDETFTFVFDFILTPKVELTLTADDHISFKEPKISKKDKEDYVEGLRKKYGCLIDVEAAESEDLLKVNLTQDEKSVDDTFISLKMIKEDEKRQPFIGLRAGDTAEVDVVQTFSNSTDRAALLKVKKDALDEANPLWQMTVLEVKRFSPSPINQELFDGVFGPGEVDSPETFMKKVEERMRRDFTSESNYLFSVDARNYVMQKCPIELPDALLKRWLHLNNDGKFSMEEIERDYDAFVRDFRWQLIRGFLMKEHNLSVTKEEMMIHAMRMAYYRFVSYGYVNVPQEEIERYARNMLSDEKEANRIADIAQDEKVISLIHSLVSVDIEKVPFSKVVKS